ncbi:MAG: helix-turn-helix domain-containing protein, partial [Candidatus Parcubacteria bacterium]|nr:helix-turn-helix domain-containing protein [Candidatus Parcubacteria bacterium]
MKSNLYKKDLISTKFAGELSGYTSRYLRRLARSGEIEGVQVGRVWLIKRGSLIRFLDTQTKRKEELSLTRSRARAEEYHSQGNHKIARARTLASERAQEYRVRHSLLLRATQTLTAPLSVPQPFSRVNTPWRSHTLAFSVALLVVAFGALTIQAVGIPKLADTTASLAHEVASGFVETFGSIPSRIAARIDAAKNNMRAQPARVAVESSFARALHSFSDAGSAVLTNPDLSALRMVLGENQNVRIASQPNMEYGVSNIDPDILHSTFYILLSTLSFAQELFTQPSLAVNTLTSAYRALGEHAY